MNDQSALSPRLAVSQLPNAIKLTFRVTLSVTVRTVLYGCAFLHLAVMACLTYLLMSAFLQESDASMKTEIAVGVVAVLSFSSWLVLKYLSPTRPETLLLESDRMVYHRGNVHESYRLLGFLLPLFVHPYSLAELLSASQPQVFPRRTTSLKSAHQPEFKVFLYEGRNLTEIAKWLSPLEKKQVYETLSQWIKPAEGACP